jgi:hypothetical protein
MKHLFVISLLLFGCSTSQNIAEPLHKELPPEEIKKMELDAKIAEKNRIEESRINSEREICDCLRQVTLWKGALNECAYNYKTYGQATSMLGGVKVNTERYYNALRIYNEAVKLYQETYHKYFYHNTQICNKILDTLN